MSPTKGSIKLLRMLNLNQYPANNSIKPNKNKQKTSIQSGSPGPGLNITVTDKILSRLILYLPYEWGSKIEIMSYANVHDGSSVLGLTWCVHL